MVELQAELRAVLAGCKAEELVPLIVVDEGHPGARPSLDGRELLHEHTDMVSGVLRGVVPDGYLGRCHSESSVDQFRRGFASGEAPIEAHAYSTREFEGSDVYHTQVIEAARDPNAPRFLVTSSGHEIGVTRFPGTIDASLSIGMIDSEGRVLGAPAIPSTRPELCLHLEDFAVELSNGTSHTTRGSSPAVVFVSVIAAFLARSLDRRAGFFVERLKAMIFSLTEPFEGRRRLVSLAGLASVDIAGVHRFPMARSSCVSLKVELVGRGPHRVAFVPLAPAHGEPWRAVPFTFETGGQSSPGVSFVLNAASQLTVNCSGLHEGLVLATNGCRVVEARVESTPVMNPDDRVVVGISASHDASACVLVNGVFVRGIQLERLSRRKHDGTSSLTTGRAIEYCLNSIGLSSENVNSFAFNVQALTPEYVGLSQPLATQGFRVFAPEDARCVYLSHHLAHAFSAYAGLGAGRAKVVVCDGSGGVTVGADDLLFSGSDLRGYLAGGLSGGKPELHTFSVYEFTTNGFKLRYRETSPSFNTRAGSRSLGEAYAAVSQYVFGSWQDSGKLMGLAPYGQTSPERMRRYLADADDASSGFGYKWKLELPAPNADPLVFKDFAADVQCVLENALIKKFSEYVREGEDVAYAGGVALNSVGNRKIREAVRPRRFFQIPAASDAGVALGAALAADYRLTGKISSLAYQGDYLGHVYGSEDASRAINRFAPYLRVTPTSADGIAGLIADGWIIGYYSLKFGSEFGPRALGARSILADPRRRETWRHINRWIKYREEFRPFAPMVLRERLAEFFEADEDLPYMLEVVKVREAYRAQLAAVTHVDGSSRVQTINRKRNPEIYEIITGFARRTGIPILLNTSFNVRGEPIVETPAQALDMLMSTQLDAVVFGQNLVRLHNPRAALLDEESVRLAPGTELVDRVAAGRRIRELKSRHQARTYSVSEDTYRVLTARNGRPVPVSALNDLKPEVSEGVRQALQRLVLLRALNRGREIE